MAFWASIGYPGAMARLDPITVKLDNGERVILRSATLGDAKPMIALARAVLASSDYLLQEPDEFTPTLKSERSWIAKHSEAENTLLLLARYGETLIGILDTRAESRRRTRHGVEIGVSVDERWRGKGVGRAMLTVFLEWARANPVIERVELHVHSDNKAALSLYDRLGFQIEGRRRGAIKFADGRRMDDILMCAYVGEKGSKAGGP